MFGKWKAARVHVGAKLTLFIRENGAPGRRKKIPQLIQDSFVSDRINAALQQITAANEGVTDEELLDKLLCHAYQALAADVGMKSGFTRSYTHMEFTLSRTCGHMVHRATCHRPESLGVVRKALLILTDGGERLS